MKIRSYIKHRHFKHNTAGVSYTPPQVAKIYGMPAGLTGSGKNVAVVELGGAYSQPDLDTYFKSLGLAVKPIIFHSVDGGKNTSDPNGADGEVMLDICILGGILPDAQIHCFTAPNTDAGFLAAFTAARLAKMDGISCSWGGPEDDWDPATVALFEAEFQACAAAGITVTCASGDNGSTDGESGSHVDFPASSPYVLGCGGTSLIASPLTEVVWNDGTNGGATGGGVSTLFALPSYQSKSGVPGGKNRGVPDVAGVADPETGWAIVVDAQSIVEGGTSAVAPLWCAISVAVGQALGKNVGFWNPTLYALPAGCFRDITSGNNGTYAAKVGWDACTGQGAPVVSKIISALQGVAPPAPVPVPPPAPVPAPPAARTIVVHGASSVTVDGKTV